MLHRVVETRQVCKRYRSGTSTVTAVDNVSVSFFKGEFVAIVGRSGSGKSTFMSLLGLLETPTSGSYFLNDYNVADLAEDERACIRGRQIGFVFQLPSLLVRASALENVELPLGYSRIVGAEARRRATFALESVGLGHRLYHLPHQLSGGEQQRVAIARAIVNDPALILADEPTGALDSKTSEGILALFGNLNREGRTIVLVTHDLSVAQSARRRVTMHDGKISSDDAANPVTPPVEGTIIP